MSPRSLLVVLITLPTVAHAAAPSVVPVTGYLTDDAGAPLDGTTTLHLKLYPGATGATTLWSETQDVDVANGQFTVYLGDQSALALDLFRDNGTVFLGIAVEDGAEMSPRFELATAPFAGYAQYCDDADTLAGIDAAEYRLATDAVDWSDLAGVPAGLVDGTDADTTYTAGTGLSLSGTTFNVDQATVEGWAKGVGYDVVSELRAALDGVYAARVACSANQVLMADSTGAWVCTNSTALPLDEATIDALVANNGYAADSALSALTARVSTAESNVSTLQSGLSTANSNISTVTSSVAALATPGTFNAGTNPVDWTKLKNVPTGYVRNLGAAVQTSDTTIGGQNWGDINGATVSVTVPPGGATVRMRANGSVVGTGGGATYTHCGFRFVIGSTSYGDGSWGDVIVGVNRSSAGPPGWWEAWSMQRDVVLPAGTYTIKLQMTGWSSSDVSCHSPAANYGAARLAIEAF